MHLLVSALMIAVFSTFISTGQCQTPPGVSPVSAYNHEVIFRDYVMVLCPGYPLSITDTISSPRLSLKRTAVCSQSTYMAFLIDIDVTFNGSVTHLLHWYQADLVLDFETRELVPTCSDGMRAEYGGPSPPDGTIHRYVALLFAQPKDYSLPARFERFMQPYIAARLFFNITEFMDQTGIDSPLAANYFTVSGGRDPRTSLESKLEFNDIEKVEDRLLSQEL